jgi:hypothetical protein
MAMGFSLNRFQSIFTPLPGEKAASLWRTNHHPFAYPSPQRGH